MLFRFHYSISNSPWQGGCKMKKLATLVLILGIWAVLASGCSWAWSKDIVVRCPKCSTTFTVEDADIRLQQLRD